MELWATGFNAWGQLQDGGAGLDSNPQDIYVFKCILKDKSIDVLRTSLSATLISTSSLLKAFGSPGELITLCLEKQDAFPVLAVAGNETLAQFSDGALIQYPSVAAFKSQQGGETLRHFDRLQQIEANQATFTALTSTGTVYTWGDGRYESCLARVASENCPPSTPSLVEDLLDLPTGKIRKISSGGYTSAALTVGNDLYLWGGRPGQAKLLEDMEEYPTPVDVEGLDFLDVAVGDGHVLALSKERRLFALGAGGNGQLGLGENVKQATVWREVTLSLNEGQKISKVYAGYKNSFVVVE